MSNENDFEGLGESNYKTGPQKTVSEYAGLDAGDESLNKWKESLGISATASAIILDASNTNNLLLQSIALLSPGRAPIIVDISTPSKLQGLKNTPFTVREGVRYQIQITFQVQREVVSGLRYLQVVKRKGISVDKFEEMVGSYGPSVSKYEKKLAEEEAPSGMLMRGTYNAKSRFTDDDGKIHGEIDFVIVIAKDWKD